MSQTESAPHPVSGKGLLRHQAIARAGARILRISGIEGLTHRAVAEEAQVPLGSTTYYFQSRDDLLNAAIEYVTDASIRWLRDWCAANASGDLATALSLMLYEYMTDRREAATLDVEIYVLAARRPELRAYSTRWTTSFIDSLTEFVGRDAATHAVVTFNGLLLIGISSDEPASLETIKDLISRALDRP